MEASSEYDPGLPRLTPEQAAEIVAEQSRICELLDTHPNISVHDIPSELISEVKLHVLTCQDRYHHVAGLSDSND